MSLVADAVNLVRRRSRGRGGWVGVDVGSSVLKLVEIEQRGESYRMARSAVIPRRPRPDVTAAPASSAVTQWISESLREHLSAANPFAGRMAACVLSMSATPLRMMDLPPGTPEEHREMAASEFGGTDPSGRRQTVGCWPGPSTSRNNLVGVYALSADEEAAVQVAEDLWAAGLRTHVLDGLPFALSRGIGLAAPDEVHIPTAALDWGHSTATFVASLDGRPMFTRVFRDCGLRAVVHSVASEFNLPVDDAERMLTEIGMPTGSAGKKGTGRLSSALRDACAEPVGRLCDELARTVEFLNGQHSELSPRRVWLYGGGGTIPHIAPVLAAACDVSVEPWRLAGTSPAQAALQPLLGVAAALSILGYAP